MELMLQINSLVETEALFQFMDKARVAASWSPGTDEGHGYSQVIGWVLIYQVQLQRKGQG